MADPQSIDDVVSSIRRLVAAGPPSRPAAAGHVASTAEVAEETGEDVSDIRGDEIGDDAGSVGGAGDALVLGEELRVVEADDPFQPINRRDEVDGQDDVASQDEERDAPRSDARAAATPAPENPTSETPIPPRPSAPPSAEATQAFAAAIGGMGFVADSERAPSDLPPPPPIARIAPTTVAAPDVDTSEDDADIIAEIKAATAAEPDPTPDPGFEDAVVLSEDTPSSGASRDRDDDDDILADGIAATRPPALENMDHEALRDLVAEIVRQELSGVLGERITRNVRKLVRRELRTMFSAEEFD
ncbi:hypothetical protein [Jannaschia aquimarina]|uniref:Uncharacterized protein n=1 Tax=Jannaschia aquimarina TaxID=935700 RepID=A0A0D1EF84_9RHOB|nr:hypothetical protein [Jannaschia aquimarina]KIT16284.1 hypothetical protein jaqu_20390 [Jannaschia aquimarina]SNT14633.1 hypothetical protein SAMN05421775_106186 [Jannaschia aquimarina]